MQMNPGGFGEKALAARLDKFAIINKEILTAVDFPRAFFPRGIGDGEFPVRIVPQ